MAMRRPCSETPQTRRVHVVPRRADVGFAKPGGARPCRRFEWAPGLAQGP
jgi:hypothetical protein